jgi:predicted 3-demethylubiquinone-9 3-methyltransferase (glyoxalase superfamily)
MATIKQRITNCLWFDSQAEEAANFYTSIFKDSEVGKIVRYGQEGFEFHGKQPGTVMTVEFELDGQGFLALNGGPQFKFNESISLIINCESQEEIDYFWEKLTAEGEEGPCGWLKDKFGVSWQVVPVELADMLAHPDPLKVQRVTKAFLQMKKFDVEKLKDEFAS